MGSRRRRSLLNRPARSSVPPMAAEKPPVPAPEEDQGEGAEPESAVAEADETALEPPNAPSQEEDPAPDLEAPPLPGGWPLIANLKPPDLPGTRGDEPAPKAPTPTPPPALEAPKPPRAEPVFAGTSSMLKGHSRPPSLPPLVSSQEVRWFAIAVGVALMMVACGAGGLIGLLSVFNGLLS